MGFGAPYIRDFTVPLQLLFAAVNVLGIKSIPILLEEGLFALLHTPARPHLRGISIQLWCRFTDEYE